MTDQSIQQSRAVRHAKIVAIVVVLALAVGGARTLWSRSSNAKALEAATAEQAKVYVKVASPKTGGGANALELSGTLQGGMQAPVASRAAGYLKRWTRDMGSRVEKGELLAEIETPDVDQQLSAALAARDQAASSLELARATLVRSEELRKTGMIPRQQVDERRAAEVEARATLAAAEANVVRLKETQAFKRVTAPFAGIITRRNVDVGDLIDGGGTRPLFVLSTTDPLRVYVDVPQAYAAMVKAGQKVAVRQGELRGRVFEGQVVRTAGAIDTATRTMQAEVQLANKDGALLPGAYVQVSVPVEASASAPTVPTATLLFRPEGLRVAAVGDGGKVRLVAVKLGRNFGPNVEILDGLKGTEKLVMNPSDALAEGDVVAVAP